MIRVGIGGWTYAPWRGPFYPQGLPQAQELSYASRHVTAIEINGTFYGTQKPESFRRWAEETPDDFIFSVKAPRFAVNRRELATAGDSISHFFDSGVAELGDKLGPVLWQLPPFKKFDAADIKAFLALMPRELGGRQLRHALEVRHPSFCVPEFIDLAREAGTAIVFAEADKYPAIADATADFMYLRLQRASEQVPTGYPDQALEAVGQWALAWQRGEEPAEVPRIGGKAPASNGRDVFVFMIAGDKVRAPAAAMALIGKLAAMKG